MTKRMTDPKQTPATSPWSAKRPKPLVNPVANDPVTVAEAVAFIVAQLKPEKAQLRFVSDAVRHRLTYALKHGHLRSNSNGTMLFGDLVTWASNKPGWRTAMKRVPLPLLNRVSGSASIGAQFGSAGSLTTPAIPSSCEAKDVALSDAYRRIRELEAALKDQNEELARLRPLEIAKQRSRSTGSESGKKGGRPPKR